MCELIQGELLRYKRNKTLGYMVFWHSSHQPSVDYSTHPSVLFLNTVQKCFLWLSDCLRIPRIVRIPVVSESRSNHGRYFKFEYDETNKIRSSKLLLQACFRVQKVVQSSFLKTLPRSVLPSCRRLGPNP